MSSAGASAALEQALPGQILPDATRTKLSSIENDHTKDVSMFMKLAEAKQCTSRKEFQRLHGEMLDAVTQLKRQEALVIRKLQEIDRRLVYRYIGYNSLFRYAVDALQLTEAQAQAFITVARKAEQLPVLQEAIDKGDLTVSKAVRITSVIDEANQTEWVDLAVRGSKREVERAVAEENPRALHPERTRFLNSHTVEIQVPMNEAIFEKLERARDLVSQATSSPASLEVTLQAVLDFYLDRKDPLRKKTRPQMSRAKESTAATATPPSKSVQPSNQASSKTKTTPDASSGKNATLPGQHIFQNQERNDDQGDTQVQVSDPGPITTEIRPGQDPSHVGQQKDHSDKRPALPAALRHAVLMRDRMQCQQRLPNGSICGERRWLEVHHIQPRAMGGGDTLENLVVLCHGHHQARHGNHAR